MTATAQPTFSGIAKVAVGKSGSRLLEETKRHIFLASGYHARTEREVEIETVLNETRPEDRDSADNAIAELLELVDAGRSRYFAERDAKEAATTALTATKQALEGAERERDIAYGRGVTAGKREALNYTAKERESYGRYVAAHEEFTALRTALSSARAEIEQLKSTK